MLKHIAIICVFGLISVTARAADRPPVCANEDAAMPSSWRAPSELVKNLNRKPWSDAENSKVERAKNGGIDEIITYFKAHPDAVKELWDDSVESLLQLTYASQNKPAQDKKLRAAATQNLILLIEDFEGDDPDDATCVEAPEVLPVAIFANKLLGQTNPQRAFIVDYADSAIDDCRSVDDITGLDNKALSKLRAKSKQNIETLFDYHLWAIWLLEAEAIEGIELTPATHNFAPKVWQHFRKLKLPGFSDTDDGADRLLRLAAVDLASHLTHIPTAVHRYPIYINDHPNLFIFLRQSFYDVLQFGDLDLTASLIDSLKQYGCTPQNDVQIRDGVRHLLQIYENNAHSWMTYLRRKRPEGEVDPYAMVHVPWTAVLGLRDRKLNPPNAGTFGAFVRKKLALGRANN